MQVHKSTDHLPEFERAVITIGTFDGVHQGHKKILTALQKEAARIGGETVVVSFHPHPRKIVQPTNPLQLINTLKEKTELLDESGVDHLVIVPFDERFSELSADAYIEKFLIQNFHPASIIIGYDHHFGKNRSGNYQLLEEKAAIYNYNLVEIPKHVLDEIDVSSTKIRNAILSSDIDTANRLLGYPFFFEGKVVKGDQLGRTIGFPTANLEYLDDDKIRLGHGVYAVYADINGQRKKGMLSIGTRPTLNDVSEKVEVNLFDFNENVYGQTLRVKVVKYLRPQEKYPSLEIMTDQLYKDRENSLAVL